MYDLLIRDATIVRSTGRQVADIAIEGGKVVYIGSSPTGGAHEEISAIGHFLIPGVIDTHVHFRDPGHNHKEDWGHGSRAAVRGGVTTVLDMPNTKPPTLTAKTVREKLDIAGKASVANYGVWVGATSETLGEIAPLWDDGLVCGTKVFLGNSTGALAIDDDTFHRVFTHTKGLIGIHAEDQETLEASEQAHKGNASPEHNDVRPPVAAAKAVERIVTMVRETGRRVHLCHLSTAAEVNVLEPHFGDIPITAEVCPHHLFLSVESYKGERNLIKVNPPVRTELDRRAMWTAVKRGRVHSFGSDHAPHTLEEKAADYWNAPSGVPGIETMVPLLLNATKHGRMNLERFVEMACEAPARIFGLKGRGRIEEGADADLVLFREEDSMRLQRDDLITKVGWSPYEGKEMGAYPALVVVGGTIVSRAGQLQDDLPMGQAVRYQR